MEDKEILDLYWARDPQALSQTQRKYGGLCLQIAQRILCREDAAECVNDAYLAAWNAIPPNRPDSLKAFLAKLVRRISINRWLSENARKRGGGQVELVLDELIDCAAPGPDVEQQAMGKEAGRAINRFLGTLGKWERAVFLRRYFLLESVAEISAAFGYSQSKVTSMLHRTRKKLRTYLEKEGYL